MSLTPFQQVAYRLFGPRIEDRPERTRGLGASLAEAGMQIRPSAYLASAYLTMVVAFGATAAAIVVLAAL